jgi:hypothetical protein
VDYDMTDGGRITFAGASPVPKAHSHRHRAIRRGQLVAPQLRPLRYAKGGRRVAFFTNVLHGDAANLSARW